MSKYDGYRNIKSTLHDLKAISALTDSFLDKEIQRAKGHLHTEELLAEFVYLRRRLCEVDTVLQAMETRFGSLEPNDQSDTKPTGPTSIHVKHHCCPSSLETSQEPEKRSTQSDSPALGLLRSAPANLSLIHTYLHGSLYAMTEKQRRDAHELMSKLLAAKKSAEYFKSEYLDDASVLQTDTTFALTKEGSDNPTFTLRKDCVPECITPKWSSCDSHTNISAILSAGLRHPSVDDYHGVIVPGEGGEYLLVLDFDATIKALSAKKLMVEDTIEKIPKIFYSQFVTSSDYPTRAFVRFFGTQVTGSSKVHTDFMGIRLKAGFLVRGFGQDLYWKTSHRLMNSMSCAVKVYWRSDLEALELDLSEILAQDVRR
jgi:hypothetical protein